MASSRPAARPPSRSCPAHGWSRAARSCSGNSFTGTAVEQLVPLFADARYLTPGYQGAPLAPVMRQVEQADTVVIEVVERFVQRYRLFAPDAVAAFRRLSPRHQSSGR